MLIGRVLGPTEVEADGVLIDLGGPLPRRLVAALLAAEGQPVSDDTLAEALWGTSPPVRAEISLQTYVSRLRRALGAARDVLQRSGDGYRLRIGETDAARFAAAVERGRELLADERPGEAARAFDAALALWRGEAFHDLPDFAAPLRARLAEQRAVAVEERLAARIATGDAPGAIGELAASVRVEPYRERRWQLLILAQYRTGRQAEALSTLRRVRTLLADDLGIDPGPALQELEGRLLAQDPRLLLTARPATAVRPLTAFLGRTAELAALSGLMSTSRLVTLVGPGGAGKTRLAVEFAAEQAWFVRLADASDPVLALAAALGLRGSTRQAVTAACADRSGLLLLDNCEHLVEPVADLVLHLLAHCPGLRVLATSREPLGVDGERLLPVSPLPAPDAVALLADRIAAVRPGWQPDDAETAHLRRIAGALDGIPLALELAAARARVLSLGDLSELLTDRFPALGPVPRGALTPHQTLEATVAWSVDLLPPPERALLLRLWPFEGGFPLAAAGADLEALSGLVARSVVVADTAATPSRYRLLEILRTYCRAHDPDPAGSRAEQAAWVRRLVARWVPELSGEHSAHAIRVLNREQPNLRAAIEHDLRADPAAALRTAGLLKWFWFRGGHVTEGLRLLTAALAGAPDAPGVDRARAWSGCATLQFIAGDLAGAAESRDRAYADLGQPDDQEGRVLHVQLLYYDSLLHQSTGDFGTAAERARQSMVAAAAYGKEDMLSSGAVCLGSALTGLGDFTGSRRVLTEAIALARARDQGWTTALGELALGRSVLASGSDPQEALAALRRAVTTFQAEDDIGNVLTSLHTGCHALALAGRPEQAATLLAAVRRQAVRRGLDPELANPAVAAALRTALHGLERDGDVGEAAMIALL